MVPSTDKPWQKKLRALKPSGSGRKRGGQKGHKGHKRELLETEACDAVHSVMPESCGHCATSLTRQPSAGLRRHLRIAPWEVFRGFFEGGLLHRALTVRASSMH